MDRSKALAALSALAHETRLDLIRLLTPKGTEGMAAGRISETLGIAAPRLSFHLSALEQAGLLQSRKVARHVFYRIDPHGIGSTISFLLNDCYCCHPEVIAACSHHGLTADQGADCGTERT
jgi:ArsR family transcriptional regulator, arsenate/arsenite/antimonite-responsive transcriptional repressor